METIELSTINDLKTSLHLTDEQAVRFVEIFEKLQENRLNSSMGEFKSLFKEDFHRLELKLEQQNTNLEKFKTELEKFKAELDFKLEQHKLEIDSKFKEQETNLEKFKAELHSKLDNNKFELELKIERSNTISVRWFLGLSVAVVLMILGLYATIIFSH